MAMANVKRDPITHLEGGDGTHSIMFLYEAGSEEPFGLNEHHAHRTEGYAMQHGGYVAWRLPEGSDYTQARHQLIAGGPDDVEHLTVTPSLLCSSCGSHGFIREGKWQDA